MGAYGITSEIIRIRSQKIRFENNDLKHIFPPKRYPSYDIPPKSNGQVKNQEDYNLQYTGTHCWMHFQAGFIK